MARPRKKKPIVDHLLITEEPRTDWQKALAHLEENYKLYIAGALFLILCVAIGALIRLSAAINERERNTLYAEVALVEDAEARLAQYRSVVDSLGRWTPEALYRMGETAIEAERYDDAEEVFNRLISEYPNSDYIVNAVDGLAFLAWNRGELEQALAEFERIVQEWPGTLVARRKHYYIGQVLEELERIEEAIAAYERQIETFPDSMISRRSEQALALLKEEYPDLFPEVEGEGEASEESMTEEEDAEETIAEEMEDGEEDGLTVEEVVLDAEEDAGEETAPVDESAADVEALPDESDEALPDEGGVASEEMATGAEPEIEPAEDESVEDVGEDMPEPQAQEE